MHAALTWAEVVPVAPLLPALAELAGYFVAFGLCIVALYFVKALFGAAEKGIGWIPWLGSRVRGELRSIEQRLTGILGGWVAAMDHRMALAWYKLAHTAEWLGHEIAANAAVLADLASLLANPTNIFAWRKVIGDVHATIRGVSNSIDARIHALTRPITGELGQLERWTYPKVRHAIREVDVVIPGEIAALRDLARAIEDGYLRVWKRLGKLEALFATGAFAAAVAIALSRLGLSWTRCSAVGRVGRTICGLGPQLIEDLLAIGLEVVVVADLCQIADAIESAAILIEPELDKLVGLSDYLCRAGGASYPTAIVDSDRQGSGGNPTALIPADLAA